MAAACVAGMWVADDDDDDDDGDDDDDFVPLRVQRT